MCTKLRRCPLSGTRSLCRCCRNIKFYTTLRLASSASSSTPVWGRNPLVWSTRVRHRSPANLTSLLVDRSFQGCIGNNFLLFAPNPNSGIRAWSMRSMHVRLEDIMICGHWSSHCYPPMYICLYLWHSWIEAAQRPTLRISRETGSTPTIRFAPYKWLCRVPVSPTIVDMASATEGT
jgi:hypothetical protein